MNCKPGDLAVVVYATTTPEMVGHLVSVVSFERAGYPTDWGSAHQEGGWLCFPSSGKIPQRDVFGRLREVSFRLIQDRFLRPIRDNDGEDETLTWAGKPEKVTA